MDTTVDVTMTAVDATGMIIDPEPMCAAMRIVILVVVGMIPRHQVPMRTVAGTVLLKRHTAMIISEMKVIPNVLFVFPSVPSRQITQTTNGRRNVRMGFRSFGKGQRTTANGSRPSRCAKPIHHSTVNTNSNARRHHQVAVRLYGEEVKTQITNDKLQVPRFAGLLWQS
jgi:hypothetical protein